MPSEFPWENLTFEGGGAKGYAYIGALQCLEREGVYPSRIRRVAGTSVGSLFAVLASLGCSTDYMLSIVPKDFQGLAKDGTGGRVRSYVRVARARGMHPGQRLYDFLGSILADKAGNSDITFQQLHAMFGRELCIPITNVTRMMTEYCHLKTTPTMPVRLAARISMSLPVLLEPVTMATRRQKSDGLVAGDVYVDGGLLCNNPLHVFDGWWLSLRREDTFFRKVNPLSSASEHYPRAARFNPPSEKTLGFTLFAASESDITRNWVSGQVALPARPSTPAAKRIEAEEESRRLLGVQHEPIQRLVGALDDADVNDDGRVTIDELESAIRRCGITADELRSVFGATQVAEIFGSIDQDDDGYIDFNEVLNFLESIGVDVTSQLVGFPARPTSSVLDFALNMLEAVNRDLTRANSRSHDRLRTVPINTDYVGTTTFDLVKDDFEFLVETGRRHTQGFLDEYRRRASGAQPLR
jgi:predicted acylesterase/phospholipase RssA/Ca2+-binding EF-hand superfamily protein